MKNFKLGGLSTAFESLATGEEAEVTAIETQLEDHAADANAHSTPATATNQGDEAARAAAEAEAQAAADAAAQAALEGGDGAAGGAGAEVPTEAATGGEGSGEPADAGEPGAGAEGDAPAVTAAEINADIEATTEEPEAEVELEDEAELGDQAVEKIDDAIEQVSNTDTEGEPDAFKDDVEVTVAMTNESLKTMYRGYDVSDLMVSLQAFESRRLVSTVNRQQFRALAMEKLEEQKSGVLERIAKAAAKLWAWIKEKLTAFLDMFRGQAKRRERILAAAKDAPEGNPIIIKSQFLATMLTKASGTKVERASEITSELQGLGKVISGLSEYANRFNTNFQFFERGGIRWGDLAAEIDISKAGVVNEQEFIGGWKFSFEAGEVDGGDVQTSIRSLLTTQKIVFERLDVKAKDDEVRTLRVSEVRSLFKILDSMERTIGDKGVKDLANRLNIGSFSAAYRKFGASGGEPGQLETWKAFVTNSGRLAGRPLLNALGAFSALSKALTALGDASVRSAKGDANPDVLDAESPSKATGGAPKGFDKANAEDVEFRDLATESYSETHNPDLLTTDQDYKQPIDDDLAKDENGEFKDTKLKVEEAVQPENGSITAAIENYGAAADVFQDGVQGLDENQQMVEILEAKQADGALDEGIAAMASLASESLHFHRFGMTPVGNYGIGFESFEKGAYRQRAASMAVESWKDKGREMIKNLIEALKKVGNMVRYLWKQFMTFFKGQEGRLERVSRQLATTPDTKMTARYITGDKNLMRFSVKGSALTASSTTAMLEAANSLTKAVLEDALVMVEAGSYQLQNDPGKATSTLQKVRSGGRLGSVNGVKSSNEEGKGVYTFTELPAGQEAVFVRPDMTDGIGAGFEARMGKGEGKAASQVKSLTKSECKTVLGSVRKALSNATSLDRDVKAVIDMVDSAVKDLDPAKFENQEESGAARKAVGSLSKVSMGEARIALKAHGIAVSVALDLVTASAGLKAEKVEDAGEGKRPALAAPAA